MLMGKLIREVSLSEVSQTVNSLTFVDDVVYISSMPILMSIELAN